MKLLELQELFGVLSCHAKRYPLARPEDFVKLLYQNEFGPGHLITDGKAAIERCVAEWEATTFDANLPLCEDIGNGLVRVNLAALPKEYPISSLIADFIVTAQTHRGSMERFRKKLQVLHMFVAEHELAFSGIAFGDFAIPYEMAGCPMVSHSEIYREAYSPAYRVVRKDLLSYQPSAEK